jgi:hypothetical protein
MTCAGPRARLHLRLGVDRYGGPPHLTVPGETRNGTQWIQGAPSLSEQAF